MPLTAGAANSSNFEYPPEEWRVVRQLVRLVGSAPTWQNVVEASDAIFHVEQMAKSLRNEYQGQTLSAGSAAVETARVYPHAVANTTPETNS